MLQLTHIYKHFEDGSQMRTVLSGLSLTVEDGEFVAITGESGAGKTTLLSILGTLLAADEGTYTIQGKTVDETCLTQLRNEEIGMVYQDHRLLPQFTAWQNILLPTLASKPASSEEELKRASDLMAFLGISHLKDTPVTVLSGGEKTRVAICRALINQPSLLLADEPTGQLDTENAHTIAHLFKKINAELHTTIVMVTHSQEMAQVAQKVYALVHGQLILQKY